MPVSCRVLLSPTVVLLLLALSTTPVLSLEDEESELQVDHKAGYEKDRGFGGTGSVEDDAVKEAFYRNPGATV